MTANPTGVKPETTPPARDAAAGPPADSGATIILAHYRDQYRPVFRRGTAVHCRDGSLVTMSAATAVADSVLIDRLAGAADAPCSNGVVKRAALPNFYSKWSRVAWGDLLRELPDEDSAGLDGGSAAADTFRRQVRAALLTEVVLGDTAGRGRDSDVSRTERRSLIDWCSKFAKSGPWRSIRSKKLWCKTVLLGGGEIRLKVALRVELFGQVRAHPDLCAMTMNTFADRAARYDVGESTRAERPEGLSSVVLYDDFVAGLTSGIADDPETPEEANDRREREAIDRLGGG